MGATGGVSERKEKRGQWWPCSRGRGKGAYMLHSGIMFAFLFVLFWSILPLVHLTLYLKLGWWGNLKAAQCSIHGVVIVDCFSQVFSENHVENRAGSYLKAVSPAEKPFEVSCFITMMLFLIVDPTIQRAKGDFYHIPTDWVSHHFISPTHQPWGRSYHCILIYERMEWRGECTAQIQRDKWKTQGRHMLFDSKAHSPPFILGQGNLVTSHSLQ